MSASDRSIVLSQAVMNLAKLLDIKAADLAKIIGIRRSSATKLLLDDFHIKENTHAWQMSALLMRLYHGVYSIVGSDELVRTWLLSENAAFDNRIPLAEIKTTQGLVHACDYVYGQRQA